MLDGIHVQNMYDKKIYTKDLMSFSNLMKKRGMFIRITKYNSYEVVL